MEPKYYCTKCGIEIRDAHSHLCPSCEREESDRVTKVYAELYLQMIEDERIRQNQEYCNGSH